MSILIRPLEEAMNDQRRAARVNINSGINRYVNHRAFLEEHKTKSKGMVFVLLVGWSNAILICNLKTRIDC